MICDPFAVVTVPFPFSDLPRAKGRKALVLSSREFNLRNGASILMMITSAARSQWHLDVPLRAWAAAGLRKPCVARAKLFTLDNQLITEHNGVLSRDDAEAVRVTLRAALPVERQPAAADEPRTADSGGDGDASDR